MGHLSCRATGGRTCLGIEVGDDVLAEETQRIHHFLMAYAAHLKQGHDLVHARLGIGFQVADTVVGVADAVASTPYLVEDDVSSRFGESVAVERV